MPQNTKRIQHILILSLFFSLLFGLRLLTPSNHQHDSQQGSPPHDSLNTLFTSPTTTSPPSQNTLQLPKTLPSQKPSPTSSPTSLILGNLLVLYGDYVNASDQEPVEVWTTLFHNLGFNITTSHIDDFSQSTESDLLVVTPSVATSAPSFGVSTANAQRIGNYSQPILLLGHSHEVLDRLYDFDPFTDFIPCVERFLWSLEKTHQIFALPHTISQTSGRFNIYANHVSYDAYQVTVLPSKTEVLGTNFDGSGAQLLWFRSHPNNPHLYYWGINQVENLNSNGKQFCENLIHWLIRPSVQQRLGKTLATWQLPTGLPGGYWEIQGAGGFGYPLEASLRFSYYVVDIVTTNGLPVNLSKFAPWLVSKYNPKRGCFEDQASPQRRDRCITTAMSLLMADNLGILSQFNTTRIGEYLINCHDTSTGGFFTELGSPETSITATRFALEALSVLNQLHTIDTQIIINYIANCQELNPLNSEFGGFYASASVGFSGSLVYATDALIALDQIDALDAINQTALLRFIEVCEEPTGSAVFDTKHSMDADEWVWGTSAAIQLLTHLDSLELYNINASRAYIFANQYPNGGWGRGDKLHDFHNSPDETWQGARALTLTGGLGAAEPNLIQYLIHCCTEWGGATEPVIFGDFLTSVDITLALSQIDALQVMNQTAFLVYLENSWSQTRTSFIAHQLPSVVGTDTDSPTPDRITLEAGSFGPLYHYGYSQLLSVLDLTAAPWITRATQLRQEIQSCQTTTLEYSGMLGLHHLYVGHETNVTFRFDTTCWNLMAHQALGGQPVNLNNASAVLSYLTNCLHSNATHQYFYDTEHTVPPPAPYRDAEAHLTETWLGLQAYTYLNPSLSDLNGQKLANYALSYLHENASILTTYYATEILHFLVETNLKPDALNLLDWTPIQTKLLAAFSFQGLVTDTSFPLGKWMPHLVNLGLQLIHRMELFPHFDINPLLDLTGITYPTGTIHLGTNVSFSGFITEKQWGHLPAPLYVQTQIFNSTYLKTCNLTLSGNFELTLTTPHTAAALGPQNVSFLAYTPGAIPDYTHIPDICLGWGTLTLQTNLSPNSTVPRSIPLNITTTLHLDAGRGSNESFTNGLVSVTVETTSDTYVASLHPTNQYRVSIPTQTLIPMSHVLQINASVPYCTPCSKTLLMTVIIFDTQLTLEQILPTTPVLFDPTSVAIGLWNTTGNPLLGYPVVFNITRPDGLVPYLIIHQTTNESGIALCSWTPEEIGQWQISYTFSGHDMFNACQDATTINVNRRLLTCTITLLPSSVLFVGNCGFVQIEISDRLNGSVLPDLLITLYENEKLLNSTTTDSNGKAICQWVVSTPIGLRDLHLEVTGTTTHKPWSSSPLTYLIRDTTTLNVITNTTQLYPGEMLLLDISLYASESTRPNGTASIYWDGLLQCDVQITQGFGTSTLQIAYTEIAGDHLVTVLFGHLDAPDSYAESSTSLLINLREILVPTMILTVTPLEIDDPLLEPTIELTVQLSFLNGNKVQGLQANLTVRVDARSDPLFVDSLVTDSLGTGQLTITTPQPGLYSVTVLYKGQRGFASCSTTTPFLVRNSYNRINSIFSPLLLGSLAVMIIGGTIGLLAFLRLQKRLNNFLSNIQPKQGEAANSSIDSLQSLRIFADESVKKE